MDLQSLLFPVLIGVAVIAAVIAVFPSLFGDDVAKKRQEFIRNTGPSGRRTSVWWTRRRGANRWPTASRRSRTRRRQEANPPGQDQSGGLRLDAKPVPSRKPWAWGGARRLDLPAERLPASRRAGVLSSATLGLPELDAALPAQSAAEAVPAGVSRRARRHHPWRQGRAAARRLPAHRRRAKAPSLSAPNSGRSSQAQAIGLPVGEAVERMAERVPISGGRVSSRS